MNDPIPQSFKVEWLNRTLKFIKNDSQMIMMYPEMPLVRVEYLHNLICQGKNDGSLGFKSLYAPVWEALRIFSLKYTFNVTIVRCKSGETGQLVIEKILKKDNHKNKENILQDMELQGKVKPKQNNNDTRNKIMNSPEKSKNQTSEICKNQISDTCKNQIPEACKNETSDTVTSEKYFQEKRKIIESISPKYLRTTLQKIFNFIDNEIEPSLVFNGLAPIEAKFLENFLGIYSIRSKFEALLSPACIDILDRMSASFKEFDKTCKLEVGAVKTDTNTNKREVTFLKVPHYREPTTSQPKLNIKTNNNQLSNTETEDSPSCKFLKALIVNVNKNNINKSQLNETNNVPVTNKTYRTEPIHQRDVKNNSNNNQRITITVNNSTIDRRVKEKNVNCHIQSKTDNKSDRTDNKDNLIVINNIAIDKSNGRMMKMEQINNLDVNGSKIDNLNITKGYLKEFLNDPIASNPSPEKNSILSEVKHNNRKSCSKVKRMKEKNFPGKSKAIQDMSRPVEIKKALRMMHLMGWEGGALGLRGEGITEPIMPVLNRAPGSGLGHICDKENETNQTKSNFRTDVLKTILDLIDRNISVSVTPYKKELSKKERSFVRNIILCINKRTILDLPNGIESDLIKKILDRMNSDIDLCIELEISLDNRKITFTKTLKKKKNKPKKSKKKSKTKMIKAKEDSAERNTIKLPTKKADFETMVFNKLHELVTSDYGEMAIDFDNVLQIRHRESVEKCCSKVNKRHLKHGDSTLSQDIALEIYHNIGDNYLDIVYGKNLKSLVIRKVPNQDNLNISKSKSEINISKKRNVLNEVHKDIAKIDSKLNDLLKNIERSNVKDNDTEVINILKAYLLVRKKYNSCDLNIAK